ncbi:hypothetical protein WSK_1908 [Novosphingobium sp. Rr 2-17]|nr:hypothetical protein WSK_1908 [Novosphingobium sp. Rr 2-17]
MAEDDARQRLDFDVLHRIALDLGEVAHLLLGELDVLDVLRRELVDAGLDLAVGQAIALAVPVIELHRQLAHGGIAACLDIGKDAFHGVANLTVAVCPHLRGRAALQPLCHVIISFFARRISSNRLMPLTERRSRMRTFT